MCDNPDSGGNCPDKIRVVVHRSLCGCCDSGHMARITNLETNKLIDIRSLSPSEVQHLGHARIWHGEAYIIGNHPRGSPMKSVRLVVPTELG